MSGGTESPRDNRSMVSPRRSTRADQGVRSPAARDPGAPPPLSGPRRAGVAVVVGALLVSIVLAMGGTARPGADPESTPGPTEVAQATTTPETDPTPVPEGPVPEVVPVILPPADTLLTTRKVSLTVTIPDPGAPLKSLELRVYRNGQPAMDPLRIRDLTMTVKEIPLKRRDNAIEVAVANASGEGPRSEPVIITVDDQEPRIDIKEPTDGSVINSALATVRGVTDPGLTVIVRNQGYGATEQTVADERGVFITEIRLDKATNRLDVETTDAAGNRTKESVNVVRGDTEPQAKLTLSKAELRLNQLPQKINIRLELNDPEGRPVEDGATVVFTLAPPGLLAENYTTTTVDGIARWDGVLIQGASKGNGWVTARAELGGGVETALASKALVIK